MPDCDLCGLPTPTPPVTADDVDGEFCCRGCLAVSRSVDDVEPSLEDVESDSEVDVPDSARTAHFDVDGMHCTTCEVFLERTACDHDGVYDASSNYATDALEVQYDPDATDPDTLEGVVSGLGYRAQRRDGDQVRDRSRDAREFARMRVFLAAFLGMAVMGMYAVFLYPAYLGYHWSGLLRSPSAAISLFGPVVGVTTLELAVVGYPILRGAYVAVRTGHLNMDVLVALGALVPYVYSLVAYFYAGDPVVYFDVTVAVLTVVTVGNYIESTVKHRTVDALDDAASTQVDHAVRLTPDGTRERVAIAELSPDDRVVVESGDRVPVDGTVTAGHATVDESVMTGESYPRTRDAGDDVVGGALVLDGSLTVGVDEGVASTLDRIVESMRHVESARSGAQRLADTLASVFVPLVVVAAVATTAAWLVLGHSVSVAVLTGVAVLVVSCPCSLGLATPLALLAGVRAAAKRNVAVVTPTALAEFGDVDVVAFDKTGTLTTGAMQVDAVTAVEDERVVLSRAAAVEADASHPVAAALGERADNVPDATEVRDEGRRHGVSGVVEGERITVGHPRLFADDAWPTACEDAIEDARGRGALPVAVGWGGRVRGVVTATDEPRPGWERVVRHLDAAGTRVVVITGDDESRVGRYRDHDAVSEVFAAVPPEAKAEVVRRLGSEDGSTVMVGEGTNDAPALAAADLGISLGSGTDVALDAADAIVRTDDLAAIEDVFTVGETTRRRVRQNLAWAFAYNAIALPLAAFGVVTPLVASVAMGASSLVVTGNAARRVPNTTAETGVTGQSTVDAGVDATSAAD